MEALKNILERLQNFRDLSVLTGENTTHIEVIIRDLNQMVLKAESSAIEFACELAELRLEEEYHSGDSKFTHGIYEFDGSTSHYTEEAQDVFNEYYDEYLEKIENLL